jgi:hypothetical protein
VLALMIVPTVGQSGQGEFGKEQPGLEDNCRKWKEGDDLPGYLLEDESKFNPMSMYTPSYYLWKIDNIELLWSLLFEPTVPASNLDIATSRLLNLVGLKKFNKILHKKIPKNAQSRLLKLNDNFKSKCLKIYYIFVDIEDMSPDDSKAVLKTMQDEIMAGNNIDSIYNNWSKKYSYINENGHERTKIGKGGSFYFSTYTKKMFPIGYSRVLNEETRAELIKKSKGDAFIIHEYMHEDDKELKSLNKHIGTDTNDRIVLYIILDEN